MVRRELDRALVELDAPTAIAGRGMWCVLEELTPACYFLRFLLTERRPTPLVSWKHAWLSKANENAVVARSRLSRRTYGGFRAGWSSCFTSRRRTFSAVCMRWGARSPYSWRNRCVGMGGCVFRALSRSDDWGLTHHVIESARVPRTALRIAGWRGG